jgi:excisionase family DNA binding protein
MPTKSRLDNRALVSITDAAEFLGVCTKTVRRRIADGTIAAVRIGPTAWRIRTIDLERMVGITS